MMPSRSCLEQLAALAVNLASDPTAASKMTSKKRWVAGLVDVDGHKAWVQRDSSEYHTRQRHGLKMLRNLALDGSVSTQKP